MLAEWLGESGSTTPARPAPAAQRKGPASKGNGAGPEIPSIGLITTEGTRSGREAGDVAVCQIDSGPTGVQRFATACGSPASGCDVGWLRPTKDRCVMGFDFAGSPRARMRRMRRDEFSRRLVREHRLTADDLIYPGVRARRREARGAGRLAAGHRAQVASTCCCAKPNAASSSAIPALALFPVIGSELKTPDGARGLESRRPRPARGAGAEGALPRSRRHHRCRARPLHQPRPGRAHRRDRLRRERRDRRRAGASRRFATPRPAWTWSRRRT